MAIGLFLLLSRAVTRRSGPLSADTWIGERLRVVAPSRRLLLVASDLAHPVVVALVAGVLCLLLLGLRLPRAALLVLVGPGAALLLTELWLKPLVRRPPATGYGDAFPSGHATGAIALVVVTVLLARAEGPLRDRLPTGVVRVVAVVGVLYGVAVAVSLVTLGFHYGTDVLGAAAVSWVVVAVTAVLLDLLGRRRGPAPGIGTGPRRPVATGSWP